MRISDDDRTTSDLDIDSSSASGAATPEPTTAELAAQKEAATRQTEQSNVIDPAASKGSIINDMA